jgi:hypothetical protein
MTPLGKSLRNTEIFGRLAARCDFYEACLEATDEGLMDDGVDAFDPRLGGYAKPGRIPTDRGAADDRAEASPCPFPSGCPAGGRSTAASRFTLLRLATSNSAARSSHLRAASASPRSSADRAGVTRNRRRGSLVRPRARDANSHACAGRNGSSVNAIRSRNSMSVTLI